MLIQFGYVAICLNILNGSPNKTITVKNLEKILDNSGKMSRLNRIAKENLETTLRILKYNVYNHISLYRLTSKLIPLATHPATSGWNYIQQHTAALQEIGDFIREHKLRISAHPDHYTVLNSPNSEVITASINDLVYHSSLLDAMGLPQTPQLVIHLGGTYHNKPQALERFIENFSKLPPTIQKRLMLENDDKVYNSTEVLRVCQLIKQPMVFDLHHYHCLNQGENLADLWNDICTTWNTAIPKIHLSSPKNAKDIRSHADFVNVEDFLPFLAAAKEVSKDFAVMIEAKQKDIAMFKLISELEKIPGIKRIDQATLEY